MPNIYRKTAKGVTEVETRAHRLTPRLRSVLIVADGRKTDTELGAMLPDAATTLAALLEQGFIEVLAAAAAPAPAAPAAPAAPTAPTTPTSAAPAPRAAPSTGAAAAAAAAGFEARRRVVLRAFNDLVGPTGESLAMRMEKTKNLDELRSLVPQAVRLVEMVQGRSAAERFAARIDEV